MDTVTWRLGTAAALGLANSQHGPGAHYRRRAHAGEAGHDHLLEPDDARAFLGGHDVPVPDAPPSQAELERLRAIRARLRALADDPGLDVTAWRAAIHADLATVDFRLRADGTLQAAADGWAGLADELLPAGLALAAAHGRIRTCGNPLCRWLFVDRSRNGSRRWCEMAVCGNRMKVGRHRLRPTTLNRPGRPSGPLD
jgi:hypothetical protein